MHKQTNQKDEIRMHYSAIEQWIECSHCPRFTWIKKTKDCFKYWYLSNYSEDHHIPGTFVEPPPRKKYAILSVYRCVYYFFALPFHSLVSFETFRRSECDLLKLKRWTFTRRQISYPNTNPYLNTYRKREMLRTIAKRKWKRIEMLNTLFTIWFQSRRMVRCIDMLRLKQRNAFESSHVKHSQLVKHTITHSLAHITAIM